MKKDNKIWIALGISLALLGSIIAVNYLYGWVNVYDDMKSMGKSVWFSFKDWVGVKDDDQIVVMPAEFAENETIVERGSGLQDAVESIPTINRIIDLGERALNRITNDTLKATRAVREVNITALQEQLTETAGAAIEFVNVTLSTGREVLAPLENATRRALGDTFNQFISGIREEFEAFFSEQNLQMLFNTIIEIPQSIIVSIQNMLSTYSGGFVQPVARVENGRLVGTPISQTDVDAMTGAW